MRLTRLFNPRSVAVVGGGAWGANVVRQCRLMGFAGPIMPVHPRASHVGGEPAHATLADLPQVPDAVFIGVNREATIGVVRELAAIGAGGAVCFASGFGEAAAEIAGADDLQAQLVAAAGEMPVLGPNCYGYINAAAGVALWPDQHGCVPVTRGVALITQSSNIAINLTMQQRALPIAAVVTAGNQAQVGLAEIGMALLSDPAVTALGLHIESFGDPAAFEDLARHARALGKPVIAIKVGASDQARAATLSHTASLAGSDAGADALLARLGIGRAHSLAAMLEALKICHAVGPLASRRIASASCSGGEASLIADAALRHGLEFPALAPAQADGLRAALGPKVALANPLDYHTYIWGDTAAMTQCFAALMQADLAIGVVVLDVPRQDRCDTAEWDKVIAAIGAAAQQTGRPMAMIATLPECLPEPIAQAALAAGIVPLAGLDDALAAIALAANVGQAAPVPAPLVPAPLLARGATLTEAQAKAALAAHGLDIPRNRRCHDAAQAAEAAQAIGFPVVVKGEGIAHKTEAGAVALNLRDAEAVVRAVQAMPTAQVLVEEMIGGALAELLIGVVADPAHGFVLTLGAGGVLSELVRDTRSLLLPVDAAMVGAAIDQLACAPLLAGWRGAPAANREAIIAAVLALQHYVLANRARVIEVEVNPLICTATRAIAVDALIVEGAAA